jgi:hypothetical protein
MSCHRNRHTWPACYRPARKSPHGLVTGGLEISRQPGITVPAALLRLNDLFDQNLRSDLASHPLTANNLQV